LSRIFIKMKKEIYKKIEIPDGVEVSLNENFVSVKGPEGENKREFKFGNLEFGKEKDYIVVGHKKATKKEKKQINTISAHIANLIKGVQKKFLYELKICFSHFPITVEIKGDEATIKNFLGEKIPRKVTLPKGVETTVNGNVIKTASVNKDLAGQAAACFEKATRITGKDRRVFQDGIFLVNKAGKEI